MDNHVIIMFFNLNFKNLPSMYEGDTPWIRKRLDLFKKYCINAFNNQTDPHYHLFLFCDKNTPNIFKQELLELEKNYKFITIIWDFVEGMGGKHTYKDFDKKVIEYYLKVRQNNSNEIICSRFENDDIPEIRYNEFVKLATQTYPIISLAKGLYWDIETNEFLDSVFPSGPFVSVKSTLDNFLSPYKESHHDMFKNYKGHPIVTEENQWIQLIHGGNMWNRIDRMPGKLIPPPDSSYLKTYFSHG